MVAEGGGEDSYNWSYSDVLWSEGSIFGRRMRVTRNKSNSNKLRKTLFCFMMSNARNDFF